MSDNVNEYGLGAPGTQGGPPVPHDPKIDPLAHGLGSAGTGTAPEEEPPAT